MQRSKSIDVDLDFRFTSLEIELQKFPVISSCQEEVSVARAIMYLNILSI